MATLDKYYMGLALQLAREAYACGEIPVGAVLIVDGKIAGWGHNVRMMHHDPLGHAEIRAISCASEHIGNWQLRKSTLYVTLEPCIMCAGALLQARLDRVVFSARDPRAGALRSLFALAEDPRLPHRIRVDEGIFAEESSKLLKTFFEELRSSKG